MGNEQQNTLLIQWLKKNSMNPTVFQNYEDLYMYMTQLVSSTFRSYETLYITYVNSIINTLKLPYKS